MRRLGRRFCCLLFCELALIFMLSGMDKGNSKKLYSWDFSDCQIRDILYVVSLDTGISIVSDDTVSGSADFRFTGKDFETAFDSFLKAARLFVFKTDEVWTVSRFRMEKDNGLYVLDACDLSAEQIVEKMSMALGKTLTYEVLPMGLMSVHFCGLGEEELLEGFCRRLNGFELERKNGGYHLAKKALAAGERISSFGYTDFRVLENGEFFLDVKDSKISDVIETIFTQVNALSGEKNGQKEFFLLVNTDSRIQRASFRAKDFDQALERICEQNALTYFVEDGLYYVVSGAAVNELKVAVAFCR